MVIKKSSRETQIADASKNFLTDTPLFFFGEISHISQIDSFTKKLSSEVDNSKYNMLKIQMTHLLFVPIQRLVPNLITCRIQNTI